MAEERKPLQRTGQLAPLSREHHEGLLFVWRIRQGLKNGADVRVIGRYVEWFRQNHLQEHFRQEEQVLAAGLPQGDPFVQRMIDEHQGIEALLHINENIPDAALLARLADDLHDHIRFEEREFFPYAEKTIPRDQLDAIHKGLSTDPVQCLTWEDPFWLKKH